MTETADRTKDIWGERTPYDATGWPARVDGFLADDLEPSDVDRWVASACLLCSNGCGLDIAVKDGRMVGVRGRADDAVNRGRLGPKGLYGWQGERVDRLGRPLVRRGSELVETSWEGAMAAILGRSVQLLRTLGPTSHAFYTSGQLMLEEYYTLTVLAKAGIGTPHTDGNTRLCTATAAASLKESFGADGQPGCYDDVDACEALFLFGHNVAETQTVLWSRILDRLHSADPPEVVCVDPRRTPVARAATLHLPLRPGTNLALMNGIQREVIRNGWVDTAYVADHTCGFEELARLVDDYDLRRVSEICDLPETAIAAAAELFGTTGRVLSTVLQGFYQAPQATASSVAVNNLHLLRGMLGRPGCGVLQMNGQPTAQNNRETGANGDFPGFRNWNNPAHVAELAELWNVPVDRIPHDQQPTHAMKIFELAEKGDVRFLWIAGTNPMVSLPDQSRIQRIIGSPDVFTVVSDGYLTETAMQADVVLPAALWGEKTGTFTNAERTVHLAERAVDPPGEARSDLDIWLAYARGLGLADADGGPLPAWSTPEAAYDAWRACSKGRPCDYSGLSYADLRERSRRWPVTDAAPDGATRLYADAVFPTGSDECETYGHDLEEGTPVSREEHERLALDGRAWLRGARWHPPGEEAGFLLNTGRTVHHFHTRTKTGRAPQLADAAPDGWCELAAVDADRLGVRAGDLVRIGNDHDHVVVPVRIGEQPEGTVFLPFHYGDVDRPRRGSRAANRLTVTSWDPVSKQPTFKTGRVRVEPLPPAL